MCPWHRPGGMSTLAVGILACALRSGLEERRASLGAADSHRFSVPRAAAARSYQVSDRDLGPTLNVGRRGPQEACRWIL